MSKKNSTTTNPQTDIIDQLTGEVRDHDDADPFTPDKEIRYTSTPLRTHAAYSDIPRFLTETDLDVLPKDVPPSVAIFDFYTVNAYAIDTAHYNDEPSATRQEFAEECDINHIMAQYEATGALPANRSGQEPAYMDVTNMPDNFQEALNIVAEAQTSFMTLPAHVRRQFDNDPVLFVEYASDPANIDFMRQWGLAPPASLPDAPKEPGPPTPTSTNPAPQGSQEPKK